MDETGATTVHLVRRTSCRFTLSCMAYGAPVSVTVAARFESSRRGDVSGPVRLTHLPISQVCAPCRPPADTAPARHWGHSCRWLKDKTGLCSITNCTAEGQRLRRTEQT